MEETVKNKKNWSMISLWILVIALLAYSAILTKGLFKARKDMAFKSDIKNLRNNLKELNYPSFTFTGEGGLQKLNDGIMVSVEKVEKYLNGYKVQLGILNITSVKLAGVNLSLYDKSNYYMYLPKTTFKINKDLNIGTLIHKTVTLENITEEELTSINWGMKASATSYYFKNEK